MESTCITLLLRHRRTRRESLVLWLGWQFAADFRLADDAYDQIQSHRRERAFPELARGLSLAHEAPVLGRDRTRVHLLRKVVDRAASNGIALLDRPFHGGDSAVTRQKRGMKSDASQSRARKCLGADTRMAVGGHDESGAGW